MPLAALVLPGAVSSPISSEYPLLGLGVGLSPLGQGTERSSLVLLAALPWPLPLLSLSW